MTKKFKIGIAVVLTVAVLATVLTATALAQEGDQPATPLEAAAAALGLTPDQLSTQLWGGKTLADLADEAGVDLQDVRDAVDGARKAAVRDSIEQAVQDGDLTREHADWLLEGLDNGFLGGRGFGGFGPFGGCGGLERHGGFGGFGGGMGFRGPGRNMRFGSSAGDQGFRGFGRMPAGRGIAGGVPGL